MKGIADTTLLQTSIFSSKYTWNNSLPTDFLRLLRAGREKWYVQVYLELVSVVIEIKNTIDKKTRDATGAHQKYRDNTFTMKQYIRQQFTVLSLNLFQTIKPPKPS